MYEPKTDETIYEIRGEILEPGRTFTEVGKCLFGYSRINGYNPKKKTAYATDLGEWVRYEYIHEVDNATLKYKKKKVVVELTKKQLQAFRDDTDAKWLTVNKTLKDFRKKVATDTIFKDVLEKYVKSDVTGRAKDFLIAVSCEWFPHPFYLVTHLGVTPEDYDKMVVHYRKNYTGTVNLPWFEYLYQAYSVIQEILDTFWTRPYDRKKRSFKEIDNLSYAI